ncbi:hypothetical protein CPG37_08925 [Malaciobacter canalis]|uniref:ABC-type transport auxiliary lipoprotein component domain-containing protein n=1 Tax=Malaciobacter canalis TaxID=1912871 RepID=A0ABX4LPN9_9BACT|nr:hypothetical protein [Malaciobacter canalis]PHO09613.1 hypothetical protein CPG37_08925 [Malaciobacter canalis]QEE31682.1 hypothetical protein ACAN_0146 [Malaciobacter canalis]
MKKVYLLMLPLLFIITGCAPVGNALIQKPKEIILNKDNKNLRQIEFKVKAKNENEFKKVMSIYLQYYLKRKMWIYEGTVNNRYYSRNTWFKVNDKNIEIDFHTVGYIKNKRDKNDNLSLGGSDGFCKYKVILPMRINEVNGIYYTKLKDTNSIEVTESINSTTKKIFEYSTIKDSPKEFRERLDGIFEYFDKKELKL